ncbi:MAG: hypothetical protein L0Y54_07045 [Sporichthyaceae bacterium]|nr:hypothetical protein [Sporichthyaceae bacterium]
MRRLILASALILTALLGPAATGSAAFGVDAARPAAGTQAITPIQIYGAWHCSNDACLWGTVRTVAQFDSQNHWLIDRGNGQPSVNLVVLSFVNPLKLLNQVTDASTLNGVPRGMTQDIVNYFTSRGIRVMVSIGGITYVDDWNAALASNPTLLGQRAAAVATQLGVGIEIDYEENTDPNLTGLQSFVTAYRAVHPYDASGADPTARLTIDVAAGDRWLIALNRKATADWLRTDTPVLDYANAMVPARQPSTSSAIANWQEHIDGKPQFGPPVPPLAPAKFTGGALARSPSVTIPTGRPSESTTGSRRTSCERISETASPTSWSGRSVTGPSEHTSPTGVVPGRSSAITRFTRSRSVTRPHSRSPSSTRTSPMAWSRICRAAATTEALVGTVTRSLVMTSSIRWPITVFLPGPCGACCRQPSSANLTGANIEAYPRYPG